MISSEVQRTLVKSPPELWSELSDPEALSRHLGELGEIRITKVEPEQSVEWEAEAAQGRIELKPSGWGTKVTMQIMREMSQKAAKPGSVFEAGPGPEAESERERMAEAAPGAKSGAVTEAKLEAEAKSVAEAGPELEPVAEAGLQTTVGPEAEAPRPGFFARLFKRRRKPAPEPPAVPEPTAEEIAAEEERAAVERAAAEQAAAAQRTAAERAAAERAAAEQATAEQHAAEQEIDAQTTELLNGVLDRLGAAHHRPFSRA